MPICYLPVRKKMKFFLEEEDIVQNPYIFSYDTHHWKKKKKKHIREEEQTSENQEKKEDNRSRSKGIQLFELLGIVIKID